VRIACLQTPAFSLDQAPDAARHLLGAIGGALRAVPRPDLLLLPEVAYPSYYLPGIASAADLDARLAAMGAPTAAEFACSLSRKAAEGGVYIAAGLALGRPDGALENAMVLYDREGKLINRVGKQFLWHFDACWFAPGAPPPITEVDGVPTGLFICCDARAPEIPRRLALAGAQLMLDSTNWVTSGRDPRNLPNAQPDYMMRVRALENGIWFAAANKVGREADSIVYCGKSCVIGPDGTVQGMASCDQPETLIVEIPVSPGGLVGAGRGGLVTRRPGEYRRLGGTPEVPAVEPAPAPYVAVVQVPDDDARLPALLADLAVHGADLVVLPAGDRPLSDLVAASRAAPVLLLGTGREDSRRTALLLHAGREVGRYDQGHLSDADRAAGLVQGPAEPPVFATPIGRIGVMIGEDGLVPEVARGLALAGADLIAWPHRLTEPWMEPFVRTRAAENRVFVAAAGPAEPGGESLVADPAGLPLARTFPGVRQAVGAYCITAVARHKGLVPGTAALTLPRYPELV